MIFFSLQGLNITLYFHFSVFLPFPHRCNSFQYFSETPTHIFILKLLADFSINQFNHLCSYLCWYFGLFPAVCFYQVVGHVLHHNYPIFPGAEFARLPGPVTLVPRLKHHSGSILFGAVQGNSWGSQMQQALQFLVCIISRPVFDSQIAPFLVLSSVWNSIMYL